MTAPVRRIYGNHPAALGILAAYSMPAGGGRAPLARAYSRGHRLYLEDVRRGRIAAINHDTGHQAGKE